MVEKRCEWLLAGYWIVGKRSDWKTGLTWWHILYQDKTSSIVTSWSCHCPTISCHHHAIWWYVMHSNCYWISPSLSPGVCQVSITFFSSHDLSLLCFIILSPTLCHMPLSLLITGLLSFPWWHFPFVLADSFVPMTHFISIMILPIVLTLFVAFVSYCCSIYGSHICGVLSWPHFCIWAALGSVAGAPQLCNLGISLPFCAHCA